MKKPEDLYDMSYYINDDLKEVPGNLIEMHKVIKM